LQILKLVTFMEKTPNFSRIVEVANVPKQNGTIAKFKNEKYEYKRGEMGKTHCRPHPTVTGGSAGEKIGPDGSGLVGRGDRLAVAGGRAAPRPRGSVVCTAEKVGGRTPSHV